MCELLAMSCRHPARLTSSLTALASHASGDSRNRDGWGLAFYQGHDVALYRDTSPADNCPLVPWPIGEALATPAFDMGCRYIIHTRGPKYYEDVDPPGNLEKAMRNTIALADENGITRLAVPAISMVVYGHPAEEAIPILVHAASEMAGSLKNLLEIRFVVVSDELLQLFSCSIAQQIEG